jgi:hypothetical protein
MADDIRPEGQSYLPGGETRAYGKGKKDNHRFKSFPRLANHKGALDKGRIKREYLASPIVDWYAYCESRNYNPVANSLSFRQWVREKKVREGWRTLAAELEDESTIVGPRTLLSAIRAAKALPETAAGMLALIQHGIKLHLGDVAQDQMKARAMGLDVVPHGQERFQLDGQGLCFYANALRQTSETLLKSLGIDSSMGLDPEKWIRLVEENMARLEMEQGDGSSEESVQVEIIGAGEGRALLERAVKQYMDHPPAAPPPPIPVMAEDQPAEEGDELGDDL